MAGGGERAAPGPAAEGSQRWWCFAQGNVNGRSQCRLWALPPWALPTQAEWPEGLSLPPACAGIGLLISSSPLP